MRGEEKPKGTKEGSGRREEHRTWGFRREPQKQPTCLGTVTVQLVNKGGGDGASEAGYQVVKALDLLSQKQWGATEGL